LDIFTILEKIYLAGHHVMVNWYYPEDDSDMDDAGKDYRDILELPFNFVAYIK
jgi:hypothetical protein